MKAPLSYVPAMPAALGLMAGIVFFYFSPSWLYPTLGVLFGLTAFIFKRHWLSFCLLFIPLGWLLALSDQPTKPPADLLNIKLQWSGEITAIHTTSSATRLTVDIDSCEDHELTPFACAVLLPNPTDRFKPGDRVEFTAKLYNPDLSVDLPDENSYNPTFFVDGITAQGNVSPDDITITTSRPTFKRLSLEWQQSVRDLIFISPISSQTAWFLSATLIGDDSLLDTSLRQHFRATGAAHYLALSGFHIGIIAMLASIAFFPLKIWSRVGRFRHLLVIALVWLYAFACGMAPSLVRAAILITIFLLAKVIQRQSSPYNSLCVAAIAILAFAPRQLFAPGFQLSFCAVLSILAFSVPLNPIKNRRSRLYRLASFFTVPVAAMLGTCMVSIFHFHRFPLLFLIPNILLAVLLPLLLTLGVILILSSAVGLKLGIVGAITDFVYNSISHLCEFLASFPNTEIRGIFLAPATIIIILFAITLLAIGLNFKRRLLIILSALCLTVATLIQSLQPRLPEAELYITRQPTHTDIVIRDRDTAIIFTTAPRGDHQVISDRLSVRYANFLNRRNCNIPITVTDSDFSLPSVKSRNNIIVFDSKTILMPNSSPSCSSTDIKIDYLIINRSVGERPFDIVKSVRPDTVVITRDMPSRRAQRLVDSCHINNIPSVYLQDHPFFIIR